jgi:hypothetical protein
MGRRSLKDRMSEGLFLLDGAMGILLIAAGPWRSILRAVFEKLK